MISFSCADGTIGLTRVDVMWSIQRALLRLYGVWCKSGASRLPLAKRAFWTAYRFYKRWVEAGDVGFLRAFVRPGTNVVDVGANVGFFTVAFGRWVSAGGRVYAFEPEEENFAELERVLRRHRLDGDVEAVRAAVADRDGQTALAINPMHPGDHRISESGVPVPCLTLDRFLGDRGWPTISLIKIDVQGAEMRVLMGAAETISRFGPALFLEVDDGMLKDMGSSAGELMGYLNRGGYRPFLHDRSGRTVPADPATLAASAYADVLFLQEEAALR